MSKRYLLSDLFSLYTRKYFLSFLFLIISGFAYWWNSGFSIFIGVLFAAIGIFYLLLKKVEFDEEFIYISGEKFEFKQLTKLSAFEINLYEFPYLVINDNGRKRRIFTDSGQAGMLRIFLGVIFPALDPLKNIKKFKELYDASR